MLWGALVLAVSLSVAAALAGRAVLHLVWARGLITEESERTTEQTEMTTMFRHEREPAKERPTLPVVVLLAAAVSLTLLMIGLALLS
jgi:hypothetical protein